MARGTGSDYDYLWKLILVGNQSTGKTCILQRYAEHTFNGDSQATLGVEFKVIQRNLDSGKRAKLQVWDTAGQERFRTITAAYYRGTDCILVVFDVCDPKSFNDVDQWLHEARLHSTADDRLIYLIGNKCDKVTERVVTEQQARTKAHALGVTEYVETSAKEGTNIDTTFEHIASQLEVRDRLLIQQEDEAAAKLYDKGTFKLDAEVPVAPMKRPNTAKKIDSCC